MSIRLLWTAVVATLLPRAIVAFNTRVFEMQPPAGESVQRAGYWKSNSLSRRGHYFLASTPGYDPHYLPCPRHLRLRARPAGPFSGGSSRISTPLSAVLLSSKSRGGEQGVSPRPPPRRRFGSHLRRGVKGRRACMRSVTAVLRGLFSVARPGKSRNAWGAGADAPTRSTLPPPRISRVSPLQVPSRAPLPPMRPRPLFSLLW